MAGIDDELLGLIPSALSRHVGCNYWGCHRVVLFSDTTFRSDDYRYLVTILQIEDLLSYEDALDCLGQGD